MADFQYIDHIAHLAKLKLSVDEKEIFVEHVENILNYVEILNEIHMDHTVFVDNIVEDTGILRNDELEDSCQREDLLTNAPSEKDGYFIVPNILDTE